MKITGLLLDNQFKYFNTTTWMANILLGASLAMEEKDGLEALDTVQNFKTGMMGPLAGIGDTLIWVLYPTIMGSIGSLHGSGRQSDRRRHLDGPECSASCSFASSCSTSAMNPV